MNELNELIEKNLCLDNFLRTHIVFATITIAILFATCVLPLSDM